MLSRLKDRIKWHIYPKLFITPKFPTTLDIEVSSACQLKCPMCAQHLMPNRMKGLMDLDIYKQIIDDAAPHVYSIKLSWRGEPLLNPHLIDMIEYAKQSGIKDVAFLTNGAALTDDLIEQLVKSGLDWISFSIDGLNETYEKIRYPAKFKEIVSKIQKLKLCRIAKKKDKPLIRVQSIYSAISGNPQEYYNFWKSEADSINFIADEARADKNKSFPIDPNYICPMPWQRMFIAFDGTVLICPCDYLARYPLGNVRDTHLYDIWHGSAAKRMRWMQKNKLRRKLTCCSDCCHGGLMENKTININGKRIKIKQYIGQGNERN